MAPSRSSRYPARDASGQHHVRVRVRQAGDVGDAGLGRRLGPQLLRPEAEPGHRQQVRVELRLGPEDVDQSSPHLVGDRVGVVAPELRRAQSGEEHPSRRLSIHFEPSTQADADVLAAARAGNAPSLPVYVVNVTPVVRLDGASRTTGTPVRMGSSIPIDVILEGPDGPTTVSYTQVAGDEIVVGVTGNGVSQAVLEKRFAANPVNNARSISTRCRCTTGSSATSWEKSRLGGRASTCCACHPWAFSTLPSPSRTSSARPAPACTRAGSWT